MNMNMLGKSDHKSAGNNAKLNDFKDYYVTVIKTLDGCFSLHTLNHPRIKDLINSSIITFHTVVNDFFNEKISKLPTKSIVQQQLDLKTIPLDYASKCGYDVNLQDENDDKGLIFQIIFLLILRPRIVVKYQDIEKFIKFFSRFEDSEDNIKQALLIQANWINLISHALEPNGNMSLLLTLLQKLSQVPYYIDGIEIIPTPIDFKSHVEDIVYIICKEFGLKRESFNTDIDNFINENNKVNSENNLKRKPYESVEDISEYNDNKKIKMSSDKLTTAASEVMGLQVEALESLKGKSSTHLEISYGVCEEACGAKSGGQMPSKGVPVTVCVTGDADDDNNDDSKEKRLGEDLANETKEMDGKKEEKEGEGYGEDEDEEDGGRDWGSDQSDGSDDHSKDDGHEKHPDTTGVTVKAEPGTQASSTSCSECRSSDTDGLHMKAQSEGCALGLLSDLAGSLLKHEPASSQTKSKSPPFNNRHSNHQEDTESGNIPTTLERGASISNNVSCRRDSSSQSLPVQSGHHMPSSNRCMPRPSSQMEIPLDMRPHMLPQLSHDIHIDPRKPPENSPYIKALAKQFHIAYEYALKVSGSSCSNRSSNNIISRPQNPFESRSSYPAKPCRSAYETTSNPRIATSGYTREPFHAHPFSASGRAPSYDTAFHYTHPDSAPIQRQQPWSRVHPRGTDPVFDRMPYETTKLFNSSSSSRNYPPFLNSADDISGCPSSYLPTNPHFLANRSHQSPYQGDFKYAVEGHSEGFERKKQELRAENNLRCYSQNEIICDNDEIPM